MPSSSRRVLIVLGALFLGLSPLGQEGNFLLLSKKLLPWTGEVYTRYHAFGEARRSDGGVDQGTLNTYQFVELSLPSGQETPPAAAQATARADSARADTAAVVVRTPPPGALERFRRDPDFQYERATPKGRSWWDRFWDQVKELLAPAFSEELSPVRRWLFYGALAAILVFAALRLLQMSPSGLFRRREGRAAALSFEEIEENLHAADLNALLEDAVAAGQYRRAVRLLYLRALQQLAARDLIRWRLDKTNRAYVDELRPAGLDAPFARLTLLFEITWYGDASVDQEVFLRVRRSFEDFRGKVET